MTPYLIPLVSSPQRLSISLAGTTYNLRVYWCRPAQVWILDILDVNSKPLILNIPLVTGADLLAQYTYAGIAGKLFAQTTTGTLLPPTFANLGSAGNLYFVTEP